MRFNEFDSSIEESAADELKRELPNLRKTDYNTIDRLMQRVSKRHRITGDKLHDMFVKKYKHTPDHWIKKYKQKLGESNGQEYVLYIDGKPSAKYLSIPEAEQDLLVLKRKFPNKKFELKQEVCQMKPVQGMIGEGVDTAEDEQKIKNFIDWTIKTINLQKPYPTIQLSKDTEAAQKGHHTGVHSGDTIWVYVGNRNLIDIFRTIFHELVHHKQDQLGMIKDGSSYPGSPIEAMADMLAGKYIKIYGKKHPEIFQ